MPDPTSPNPSRSAGRPRGTLLSRERILEAAFSLAEERGSEFTLAALAARLDVRPSALHHHFAGKSELIAGMRGRLTARIGDHGFADLPWYEAVVPWARAYRETLGSHPALISALATLPIAGEPESIADYGRIAEAFVRDGYPEHRVIPALTSIESFIIGSALDALAPDDNLRPVDGSQPTLERVERAARDTATRAGETPATAAFEFGLAALISGLRLAGAR